MVIKQGNTIIWNNQNYAHFAHMEDDATKSISEKYDSGIELLSLPPVYNNTPLTANTTAVGSGTPEAAAYTTTIDEQSTITNDLFNHSFLGVSSV